MRRVLGSVAAGMLTALLSIALSLHFCGEGNPVMQWAGPSVCVTLALIFVGRARARVGLALAAALVAVTLSTHYASVVHGNIYTGAAGLAARTQWHSPLTGLYLRAPRVRTFNGATFSVDYPVALRVHHATDTSVEFATESNSAWPYGTSLTVSRDSSSQAEVFASGGGSHVLTQTLELARNGARVRMSVDSDTDDWGPSEDERREDMRRVVEHTIDSFRPHTR
ncbi:MAG: hypothetical protein IPK60_13195 [Sandaracinaceae bacterium]|jgi:hypothetical protein|nr:hypothetical protein [Sandaracinaceae bacterium]